MNTSLIEGTFLDGDLSPVSSEITIKNKTGYQLAVSIHFMDSDDDWVTKHYIIDSGETLECCYTGNKIIYYYAVDTHGYAWQIRGSSLTLKNYYHTYVGFRKKVFDDLDYPVITLTE